MIQAPRCGSGCSCTTCRTATGAAPAGPGSSARSRSSWARARRACRWPPARRAPRPQGRSKGAASATPQSAGMNFSRTCALLFAAPLATLCVAAGAAQAADVASVTIGDGVVRYEGTPGDDQLRTGYSDGAVYFGQITGAPITAGPGCDLDDKYTWVT